MIRVLTSTYYEEARLGGLGNGPHVFLYEQGGYKNDRINFVTV